MNEIMSVEEFRSLKKGKLKYGNRKKTDGVNSFDSRKEFKRWQLLLWMQRDGIISNLKRQEKFDIVINGIKVCTYISDFTYWQDGKKIVEDVKSEVTRRLSLYRLKNKLMKAVLNIEIKEV